MNETPTADCDVFDRALADDLRRGLIVAPEWIKEQREQGWPNMHPEDYCHKCGSRNPRWYTDRETWESATSAWATETGREGICCPTCFIDMAREAGIDPPAWLLTTRPISSAEPVSEREG